MIIKAQVVFVADLVAFPPYMYIPCNSNRQLFNILVVMFHSSHTNRYYHRFNYQKQKTNNTSPFFRSKQNYFFKDIIAKYFYQRKLYKSYITGFKYEFIYN